MHTIIYRNTVIEDFHADCQRMNKELYEKMYKVVYSKIKKIEKYGKYLYLLDHKENLSEELDKIPDSISISVIKFIEDILFNSCMGSGWDEPELIDKLPVKGTASYILAGKFKECCNNNDELTDRIMCYINKDIHNRIYTLIVNGLLPG